MRKSTLVPFIVLIALPAVASQPLETETARMLGPGILKLEGTMELQTSRDGRERAFPFVIEYGFTDRTEIAVEPVFGTKISPKGGAAASGAGDIEVTVTHLLLAETPGAPAFAVAGELKLPTARNPLIGTRKTDFTAWFIGSKRFDRLDFHGNLGYTVLGRPAGVKLKNIINYAVAEEFHLSPRFDIVGELVGNTSSTGDTAEGTTPTPGVVVPAEVVAAETSVLLGVRYYVHRPLFLALGLAFDNNHALLVRAGITYRFGIR
jgi:hypothetical protein